MLHHLKTYKGYGIKVNSEDGRFTTTLDGVNQLIAGNTLNSVEQQIDKKLSDLEKQRITNLKAKSFHAWKTHFNELHSYAHMDDEVVQDEKLHDDLIMLLEIVRKMTPDQYKLFIS